MKKEQFFVTGIDTEVGKTVISAMLTEALEADYWKPIQSGDLHDTDTDKVKNWVTNSKTKFWKEAYAFKTPASPHYSAALEDVEINLNQIVLPQTENNLVVEGAGGLMVPLNDRFLIIDLIKRLGLPVVLVSRNYLGSINHTLLSIKMLQESNILIKGLVFNGDATPATEDYILKYTGVKCLGKIPKLSQLNPSTIRSYGKELVSKLIETEN